METLENSDDCLTSPVGRAAPDDGFHRFGVKSGSVLWILEQDRAFQARIEI